MDRVRLEAPASGSKRLGMQVPNFFPPADADGFRIVTKFRLPPIEEFEQTTPLDPLYDGGVPPVPFLTSTPTLITRMGAKSQLAAWLVEQFPPCHTYVEPFFATGRVLFTKPRRDKVEIVNDFDADLIEFWRWVVCDPVALLKCIRSVPTHEAVLMGLRENLSRRELQGVERAAAWFLGSQSSYNAIGHKGMNMTPYINLNLDIQERDLMKAALRLKGVMIRSRSFPDIITWNNKALSREAYPPGGVFFYLDPPYWGTEDYKLMGNTGGFGWDMQVRLAEKCVEIDEMGNQFIETNSAHEDLKRLYGGYKRADGSPRFIITPRKVKYSMASGQGDLFDEYVISNFPLRAESARQTGLFESR